MIIKLIVIIISIIGLVLYGNYVLKNTFVMPKEEVKRQDVWEDVHKETLRLMKKAERNKSIVATKHDVKPLPDKQQRLSDLIDRQRYAKN